MTGKKVLIILSVVAVGGITAAANYWYRRDRGVEVIVEAIRTRDLEAVVSASGKIRPKRQVSISANQMGRVTRVAVREGDWVKAGQFLLEIDPRQLEGQILRGEASVAAAESALRAARVAVEQARANLALAQQNLGREEQLWAEGLTTRQALERAQNDVTLREADLRRAEQEIQTREQQIRQEQAQLATTRYNLTQIIISSPMDGIVTRRNIEEGETAVVGTMNNAGSQLLTIADMSVIEAEVEVDETDIPSVAVGQEARVTIDAVPNRTFRGRVTEIGNSPIQPSTTQTSGQRQATNFKVIVTLDEEVPDVRPGFTCTAEITTATRTQAIAVPIQALAVREMLFGPDGALVREEPPARGRRGAPLETPLAAATEVPPGHTRRETEGVFVFEQGRAVFTPIRVGIAGERYFEVLDGLRTGMQVITGPFASVRELPDGAQVRLQQASSRARR